jgi:hypothetical protein
MSIRSTPYITIGTGTSDMTPHKARFMLHLSEAQVAFLRDILDVVREDESPAADFAEELYWLLGPDENEAA